MHLLSGIASAGARPAPRLRSARDPLPAGAPRPRLSVDQAWQRLTDWPLHADVVPLTRITVLTEPPSHEGTAFVGRTGVGPLGFDDPMEVTAWEPPPEHTPARCRLEKHGRLLRGWVEFRVHPHPRAAPAWSGRRTSASAPSPA